MKIGSLPKEHKMRKTFLGILILLTIAALIGCPSTPKKPDKPDKQNQKLKRQQNFWQTVSGVYRVRGPQKKDQVYVPPGESVSALGPTGQPQKPRQTSQGSIQLPKNAAGMVIRKKKGNKEEHKIFIFDPTQKTSNLKPPRKKTVLYKDKVTGSERASEVSLPWTQTFVQIRNQAMPDTTLALDFSDPRMIPGAEVFLRLGKNLIAPFKTSFESFDPVTGRTTAHYTPNKGIPIQQFIAALQQGGSALIIDPGTPDKIEVPIRTPLLIGLGFAAGEVDPGQLNAMALYTSGVKQGDLILIRGVTVSNGRFSDEGIPRFSQVTGNKENSFFPKYMVAGSPKGKQPFGVIVSGSPGRVNVSLVGRIVPTEQGYTPNPVDEEALGKILEKIGLLDPQDLEGSMLTSDKERKYFSQADLIRGIEDWLRKIDGKELTGEQRKQAEKLIQTLSEKINKTRENHDSLKKTHERALEEKEKWKKDPVNVSPPTENLAAIEKMLKFYEEEIKGGLHTLLKLEHLLGKHGTSAGEIQIYWGWKELIVTVGKTVYRLGKTGLGVIKNATVAVIKFGGGVAYAVIRTGLEPILLTADIFRLLFGAETPWSFTGELAVHIAKVGVKQAIFDMAKGMITLPAEMAKAFYEGRYFALGEMVGYIVAGKMKLPIKFLPQGGKIVVKFTEEALGKLKKYLKEKGATLSKAAKEKLLAKIERLEKNPVIAVLHSIEEAISQFSNKVIEILEKKGLKPNREITPERFQTLDKYLRGAAEKEKTKIVIIPPGEKPLFPGSKTRSEAIKQFEQLLKTEENIDTFRETILKKTKKLKEGEVPKKEGAVTFPPFKLPNGEKTI